MKTGCLILLLACLITGSAVAQEATVPVVPNDFAYGIPLSVDGSGALYHISLPVEVYRGLVRADQGDLCVFNSQGEMVPFALRRPETEPAPAAKNPLRFFPVPGASDSSPDILSLLIRRDSTGAIIDVNTKDGSEGGRKVVAYLLDASALERAVKSLDLNWQQTSDSFIGKISVRHSDDLEHWFPVVEAAAIANLNYGGYSLVRREISFQPVRAKYLQLSWPPGQEPLNLTEVTAQLAREDTEQPRRWENLEASVREDHPGEYTFDTRGFMPVDRLKVKLPEKNTLVKVSFLSRGTKENKGKKKDKDNWHPRHTALVYDLHIEGERITNPDIVLKPGTDRFWMMRIDQGEPGIGKGRPELQVGWVPQQVLFVARGEGPFTLAYGSAKVDPGRFHFSELLTQFTQRQKDKVPTQAAQAGTPIALGDEAVRTPHTPLPWKQWILWGVLIVGVALLAGMAVHLYRQMGSQNNTRD